MNRQSIAAQWMLVCAALILLLAFLSTQVTAAHSMIRAGDLWFEHLLLAARTPFLLSLFERITFFGEIPVVTGIAGLASIAVLLFKLEKSFIAGLGTALVGSAASSYLMKAMVERARPDGLIPAIAESSFSFPSGHATLAMALYGFVAYMLCKLYPKHTTLIVTAASAIILLIGFSRLYLGVHFPSDVVAGYLLGGLWLLVGVKVTKIFQSQVP